MTAPYGMTLTDYLNECKAQGVGLITLADVMTETVNNLNLLAGQVECGRVCLTVARGRLTAIIEAARSACYAIGKNDGWLYVVLEVKARDVLSFAGRCEVAAIKVDLMKGELVRFLSRGAL